MKSPLLVTGSHRSGKGFIIKGINIKNSFNIINEPLNIKHKTGWIGTNVPYYFLYIDDNISRLFKSEFDRIIYKYNYRLINRVKSISSFVEFKTVIKDFIISLKYKINNNEVLIDDPFAVFSAEWFYKEYGARVIIMIRHPASFVCSLKLLGYKLNLSHISNQRNLVESKLRKYNSQLIEFENKEKSIVEQGVLLWRMIYDVVNQYKNKYHSKWMFVRFEDVVRYSEIYFYNIYKYIGLPINTNDIDNIKNLLLNNNAKEDKEVKLLKESNLISGNYSIKDHLSSYKIILTKKEIAYIKDNTKDVWRHYYSNEDWL